VPRDRDRQTAKLRRGPTPPASGGRTPTESVLTNRAENSHRPTRRRERQMQRFKSPGQAQDFLSAHAFINGHFRPRRHLLTANNYRAIRSEAFRIWKQETCAWHVG
jgi:putative transposase